MTSFFTKAFGIFVLVFSLSSAAEARSIVISTDETIKTELAVKTEGDDLVGTLTYTNTGSESRYLITGNTGIDFLYWPVLEIRNENGESVKAIDSSMVDRKFSDSDFKEIKPGETITAEFNLNETYIIEKGHKYTIKYNFMPAVSSKKDIDGNVLMLGSNTVVVDY